jgi:uncharacterized membrane protein YgcG
VVRGKHTIGLLGALALVACAESPPSGPSVVGLPPQTKDLAQFQQEDSACRQYASQQTSSESPAQATSQVIAETLQQRYDTNYVQCMYFKGNIVMMPPPDGYPPYAYYPYPYYDPWFWGVFGVGGSFLFSGHHHRHHHGHGGSHSGGGHGGGGHGGGHH